MNFVGCKTCGKKLKPRLRKNTEFCNTKCEYKWKHELIFIKVDWKIKNNYYGKLTFIDGYKI